MEEDEYSKISMPIESEYIMKQVVDYNLEKIPGSARMAKNLPMDKVQSALRLLSEMSRGHPKQIDPESIFVELESKLKSFKKIPKEQIKPDGKSQDLSNEAEIEYSEKNPFEIVEEFRRSHIEEYESDEESKENLSKLDLEIKRERERQKNSHTNDEYEELCEADEYKHDALRITSRGICLELAENSDKKCKKGICKPTPDKKEDDSISEGEHTVTKKICIRGKEKGMLTCIERSPAFKEKKIFVEENDAPRCNAVIETTLLEPLQPITTENSTKIDLPNEKTDVEVEEKHFVGKKPIGSTNKNPEGETTADRDTVCSDFNIDGIITDEDDEISENNLFKKEVNVSTKGRKAPTKNKGENQVGGVCECCKCVICKCELTQKKRLMAEEAKIQVKKVKDLQAGRAIKPILTKYSWDTIDVPDPWDFVKDQEDARQTEKKELIARASQLEKEQKEAIAAFNSKMKDDGEKDKTEDGKTDGPKDETRDGEEDGKRNETEDESKDEVKRVRKDERKDAESMQKSESDRDWDSYKAIEWAGLRHEYTEKVKSVDLDNLSELDSISWTSQPPPQLVVGTVETQDTTEENKKSSVATGSTGFRKKSNESNATTEQHMERRRKQMLELKKIQETRVKRKRDVKKGVQLTSVSQIHSIEKEKEIAADGRETYDTQRNRESVKRSNDIQSEHRANKISGGEIDENLLPMGLKRGAEILRKSDSERTDSIISRPMLSIAQSLPFHEAERLMTLQSLDDFNPTKSCSCLPGYCTCGEKHWAFQSQSLPNLPRRKSEELYHEDPIGRTDSELMTAGIYLWKKHECPCSHSYEEIHSSPVTSEDLSVQKKPSPRRTEEYTCSCKRRYEQTVVIVKPDAMIFEDVIRRALVYVGGLQIVNERRIRLSPEQVSEIYADKYYGSQSYPLFVLKMSRMTILALSVAGLQVMDVLQRMVGNDKYIPDSWFLPESIKRRILNPGGLIDALHISEDPQQSCIENRYFFPQMLVEPIATIPNRINDFCKRYLDPTLSKGLAAVARTKPVDPVIFLAEWLLTHNPFQPWYKPQRINMLPT